MIVLKDCLVFGTVQAVSFHGVIWLSSHFLGSFQTCWVSSLADYQEKLIYLSNKPGKPAEGKGALWRRFLVFQWKYSIVLGFLCFQGLKIVADAGSGETWSRGILIGLLDDIGKRSLSDKREEVLLLISQSSEGVEDAPVAAAMSYLSPASLPLCYLWAGPRGHIASGWKREGVESGRSDLGMQEWDQIHEFWCLSSMGEGETRLYVLT